LQLVINIAVSFAFRRFGTWTKFRDNVVLKPKTYTRHKRHQHENVVMFEFFMPLRMKNFCVMPLTAFFTGILCGFGENLVSTGFAKTNSILKNEQDEAF